MTWQGNDPPPTIQDVYDFIDRTLKIYKTKLITKVEKLFFGGIDPIQYLIHIEEIFKSKHRVKRVKTLVPKIGGFQELDLFIRTCSEVRRPGGVREAGFTKDLQSFSVSYQRTIKLLAETLEDVRDLYDIVQTFCRNYQSLEGEFELKWARSTNLELKGTLNAIEELISQSDAGVDIKLFSSDKFSLEVAETCDTKRFPVLQLFPDLFQKFHFVFHLMGKWRANDQIYLEDIQFKLIKTKRLQRLKQEEYNTLELEHGNILSGIVEKRVRVKCREMRDRIKQLDSEVYKLTTLQRSITSELTSTEQEIQERKRILFMNKNVTDITKDLDNILGIRKDLEILSKKLKSLTKSVKLNEHDLNVKEKEKVGLEEEYEDMRKAVSRSNQLAYERSELAKDIAVINEKIQELETIFYRKTDRKKLTQAYEVMTGENDE
ncbi:uncharacterized protein [Apostichopus japonicus]|uniref:uncharacterized protein n=1 Tax=Stichopus japonicus TaxID=307972 RepID=UPI003AB1451F